MRSSAKRCSYLKNQPLLSAFCRSTHSIASQSKDTNKTQGKINQPSSIAESSDAFRQIINVNWRPQFLIELSQINLRRIKKSMNEVAIENSEESLKQQRAARRKMGRRYLKKHCCRKCGQPKHYVCLQHNFHQHPVKESSFKKLLRRRRYYARKLYFTVARKLRLVS